MCFYAEYDWVPELSETRDTTASEDTTCDECYRPVKAGAFLHTIYQQEHEDETCGWCHGRNMADDGECMECAGTGQRGPGNTFECKRCEDCHKFLAAIEAAELEAGCDRSEARPALTEMQESLNGAGGDEAKKYFQAALRMFPELKPYLGWLWRKLFV